MELNVLVQDLNVSLNFTDKFLGSIFIFCLFIFAYLITRTLIKFKHKENKTNPLQ